MPRAPWGRCLARGLAQITGLLPAGEDDLRLSAKHIKRKARLEMEEKRGKGTDPQSFLSTLPVSLTHPQIVNVK